MQNDNDRDNGPFSPSKATPDEVRELRAEVGRLRESMEQSRLEFVRTRGRIDQQETDLQSNHSGTKRLLLLVIAILIALAGISWYAYPRFREHGRQLAELSGLSGLVTSAGERIASLESGLTTLTTDHDQLEGRMTNLEKLERSVSSSVGKMRSQAQQMISQAQQQIRTELSSGLDAVKVRMGNMESAQETDRLRLAELQKDLSGMRQEVAGLKQQTDEQIADVRYDATRNVSDLNRRLVTTRDDLNNLNNEVGVRRVDFELPEHQTQELTSGIRLQINDTNVGYQRIEGFLHVVADGRVLRIRSQSVTEPVVFYTQKDPRPYQLVFTHVTDHAVTGYLLMPKETKTTVAAADTASQATNLIR